MPNPLAEATVALLKERGLRVAVAETDTGGLIGSWFTDVAGCSAVFVGGATPYHNRPKGALLGVPADLLRAHGSVSEEAAVAMAQGARRVLGTEIGASETGITGPTGGSAEHPVGTVWMAVAGPGDRVAAERRVWDSDREGNKARTVRRIFELIQEAARTAEP